MVPCYVAGAYAGVNLGKWADNQLPKYIIVDDLCQTMIDCEWRGTRRAQHRR